MIRQQNFKKNPHTARFLMAFHAGADNAPEGEETGDLLELVPTAAPAFQPSANQVIFMSDLIRDIDALDSELGQQARDYTVKMTDRWTPGREGNLSTWIDRLKAKRAELRATAPRQTAPAAPVEVADGRYAVTEADGVLRFFKVKNGDRAGFVFLDVQASDDWHPIRSINRKSKVLALIAADPEEASLRYGRELGICGDCGRTLTDENSRARGRGPICDAKH